MLTSDDCKRILSKLGFKLGVSPNLIATRLLNDQDKSDMMEGVLTIEALEQSVKVWRDNGMPDYAHDKTESYEEEKRRIRNQKILDAQLEQRESEYRKPFIDYRIVD